MQTKTPNQYRDANKKQQGVGVDHTLTPGQNPVPPDDQNRQSEWKEKEKVDESEKRYAGERDKNQKTQHSDLEDENVEDDEREDVE